MNTTDALLAMLSHPTVTRFVAAVESLADSAKRWVDFDLDKRKPVVIENLRAKLPPEHQLSPSPQAQQ